MNTVIPKQNVRIVPTTESEAGELADVIHYECAFCEKLTGVHPNTRRVCEKLSGKTFYCVFCLRNRHNAKSNRHILPVSFRAIAGYYFYEKYHQTVNRQMWLAEIRDMMKAHEIAGLQNPVFNYDPETFMWFIDFGRIGRGRNKIRIAEVHKTIINILACFNLQEHIPNVKPSRLVDKYMSAVRKFYSNRYRPAGRRMVVPTLAGCGILDNKKYAIESTKIIMPRNISM